MSRPIPLNKDAHVNTRVVSRRGADVGDAVNVCSVVPREFGRLITHYPIVLARDSASDSYNFCALLGFDEGENLFLDGAHWDADYIPLEFLRGPFLAGVDESGGGEFGTVYIDMGDVRVQEIEGERLFEPDGSPSKYLQGIDQVLSELITGVKQTRELVGMLEKYKLIEPVTMKAAFQDGKTLDVDGLFSVHDEAVRTMPQDAVLEFHQAGFLAHLYIQQASTAHLGTLIGRRNARIAAR